MGQFSGMDLTEHTYQDGFRCPDCGTERAIVRLRTSAGREVTTWCYRCQTNVKALAGAIAGQVAGPCPFCGWIDSRLDGDGELQWFVCLHCSATGPAGHNEQAAVAAWNRRP